MHRHLSKLKNKKTLIAVLACLGIILTTVGVTVAWFTYARNGQKENSITSGKITFIYQENEGVGNGISLTDAMPMPDSYGKTLEEVFDFRVTSTSGTSKIPYEITLRPTDNSDNIGNTVKVYLTKVNGANEEQKVLSMYSDLQNSTNAIASINNEKTLYQAEILAGASNYTDNYRLRMWLNDNPSDGDVLSYEQTVTQECTDTQYLTKETCEAAGEKWLDKATPAATKNFTVKVNVYAEGEAATAEEITNNNSTNISKLTVSQTEAQVNTNSNLNYDYYLTTPLDEITINVETSNPNATVTVTEYNPTAMNTNVRRLSTSNTFELNGGDNYFKITVTSANKAQTDNYILKVTKSLISSIPGITYETDKYVLRTNNLTNYVLCASDSGTCNIPYHTVVIYGANGVYHAKEFDNSPTCMYTSFYNVDPQGGVVKNCYYYVIPDDNDVTDVKVNNTSASYSNSQYAITTEANQANIDIMTYGDNVTIRIDKTASDFETIQTANSNNFTLTGGKNYFVITTTSADPNVSVKTYRLIITKSIINSIPGITYDGSKYILETNDISNYTYCGSDGGTCNVPNYTVVIYGGTNGIYHAKEVESSILCHPNGFYSTDPQGGVVKSCYYYNVQ